MNEDWVHKLDAAVSEVFTLMLGRRCDPSVTGIHLSGYAARIDFSGSLRGRCTVQLNGDCAEVLAAELTGESTPDFCRDTAGELCNMIAGSWKSRLPGAYSACKLSVPTTATLVWPPARSDLRRTYCSEQMSLTLSLELEQAA